ncbi:MAG TPA: alpha/beta fold hydrolase [Gemmataceae bacterium]|nr:alpha/beta fold hydrolase [Gemmataceae bacterium]
MAAGPPTETHRRVVVDGVGLHVVERGAGPPVVFLHGFPEFWYSWRHQLPAVAAAGYRAVAPDLRGYNESDRPPGVRNYRPARLVADAAGLIEALGAGPAVVVGHDWGGIIAWLLVMRRPDLVRGVVVLNAPHPGTFPLELTHVRQLWRSWYAIFFQLPWLPEAALRFQNFAVLARALRRGPAHGPEDVRLYTAALARPGALAAAINYYRAAFRYRRDEARHLRPVRGPALVIWGERDAYLNPHVLDGLPAWAPDARLLRLPDARHWVQNDAPDVVNAAILGFLADLDGPRAA